MEVNNINSEVNTQGHKEAQGNKPGNKKSPVTLEPGESTEDAVIRLLATQGVNQHAEFSTSHERQRAVKTDSILTQ